VRKRRDSVVNAANSTIDEKVKNPAYHVAQGLDHQLTPFVNYFESAVTKLNGSASTPPSPPAANGEPKYQYQRALALSKDLKDSLYVKTNEQLKQLQTSNVLVQRATETAQKITTLASSSIQSAQSRIYHLSDTMISDLKKVQSSLTSEFNDVNTSLSGVITDLKATLTSDLPIKEKITKFGGDVKDYVSPILGNITARVKEILAILVQRGEEAVDSAKRSASGSGSGQNGRSNGYAR